MKKIGMMALVLLLAIPNFVFAEGNKTSAITPEEWEKKFGDMKGEFSPELQQQIEEAGIDFESFKGGFDQSQIDVDAFKDSTVPGFEEMQKQWGSAEWANWNAPQDSHWALWDDLMSGNDQVALEKGTSVVLPEGMTVQDFFKNSELQEKMLTLAEQNMPEQFKTPIFQEAMTSLKNTFTSISLGDFWSNVTEPSAPEEGSTSPEVIPAPTPGFTFFGIPFPSFPDGFDQTK
ncbi:hypothetical protein ACFYKX_11775 [Cytobacillus sp. FJAT-54145]|uniref:Uncharacterized protein n=1 Tax=Cytobacillus spartinae TaxID=3299023 RepID=A0ABW6KAN0_9BACI